MWYNLNEEVKALESLYAEYNKNIFGGKLPKVVITIQRDGGLKCTGYFTAWEAWKSKEEEVTAPEISITAEELNRTNISIAETLLHESVHAYNYAVGVKDTSRAGTFHNKKFKAEAEARGLITEEDKKYGCITVGFVEGSRALKVATEWANKTTVFEKYRYQPEKVKPVRKKVHWYKYKCPCCEAEVQSKTKVNIRCSDCEMDFILQED